jgi:hypothetical protein
MATTFILFTLVFWSYALNHYFLNKIRFRHTQSTYIYLEYHSVCPLVGIGTPLPPFTQASVSYPLNQRGGGHTRLRLRGWGQCQ